jgi:hypothetical protein
MCICGWGGECGGGWGGAIYMVNNICIYIYIHIYMYIYSTSAYIHVYIQSGGVSVEEDGGGNLYKKKFTCSE